MLRLSQLSITQYCCVNCDPDDLPEAGEPGCKGQAATQVKWSGVRGHLSSMSGLLIRKCCLSLQGVHRVCRVLDAYSQSDINLLRRLAAQNVRLWQESIRNRETLVTADGDAATHRDDN